ncbi:PspA/IM30 family protein [Peribacillus sp. SCS-155]|uniref:PspA/IM30 family protein n=1 Tax=Peribacillus sedimenti TaxID=3115297 RepID=UPI00390609F1
MSNLFTRIKEIVIADLNEALDQKERKNPIAMLNHYLRQCEQETEKVRKLVERQYLLKEEFRREYKYAKEFAEKRQHQAEIAASAGEGELASFAVEEQMQYEQRGERLKASLENAEQQLEELQRKYEEMKHKIKDMHLKRLELMGKENISRAHHRMNKVIDNNKSYDRSGRFEEMEEYIERLEHQVESSYLRNTIDNRIAEIEKEMKSKESKSII